MDWKHIMNARPEVGRWTIELYPPSYGKHWEILMRKYVQFCSFEHTLEARRRAEMDDPNYWWIYADDFPFPPDSLPNLLYKNEVELEKKPARVFIR